MSEGQWRPPEGTEYARCSLCDRRGAVQRRVRLMPYKSWYGPRSPIAGQRVESWECVDIAACRHARRLPPWEESVRRQLALVGMILFLAAMCFAIARGLW